jgi:hypothetical protein
MKTTISIASLCAALLAFSTGAQAQEPYSNTARVGMYAVFYHTAADQVSGPFVPPGVSADVGNVQTVYLAYLRRLTSRQEFLRRPIRSARGRRPWGRRPGTA